MTSSPRACTIWFTGLFGKGKTMIVETLVPELLARGCKIEFPDEEVVRAEVNWDFVLSHRDRTNHWKGFALTCLQSPASGKFIIFPAGSFEAALAEVEIVCDLDREPPQECAKKVLRKLEQLECFAPFGNHDRPAYSDAEEALVAQRLEELGYV